MNRREANRLAKQGSRIWPGHKTYVVIVGPDKYLPITPVGYGTLRSFPPVVGVYINGVEQTRYHSNRRLP